MATINRSFAVTGAALATAAAIAAVPAVQSAGVIAAAPMPTKLSMAQYELTALTDITLQGINDAIATGWGGNLGPSDPFYPGAFNNDVKVTGINGALYYVLDQSGFVPANLEDYYFEAGGLKAVAYVGISSIFGANSLPGQLAKAVFGDQTMTIQDAVVALTAGIPIVGDLTSVYFTGLAVNDTTAYGTGFAGVLAYVNAKYPAIGGLLSNLNIGSGSSHSDSDSDSEDSSSDSHDGEDDETESESHGHGNSAASVLTSARTAARPAAAVKPVAALSAAAEAPSNEPAAEPTTPDVTVGADAPADTDAVVTAPAPKRVAAHASRAAAADKGPSAPRGESKRAKAGSN